MKTVPFEDYKAVKEALEFLLEHHNKKMEEFEKLKTKYEKLIKKYEK